METIEAPVDSSVKSGPHCDAALAPEGGDDVGRYLDVPLRAEAGSITASNASTYRA